MKRKYLASRALCCLLGLATISVWSSGARAQEADYIPKANGGQIDAQAWLWRVQPAVGPRYQMRLFSRTETNFSAVVNDEDRVQLGGGKYVSVQKATLDLDVLNRDKLGATTFQITFVSIDSSLTPSPQKTDAAQTLQADAMFRGALIGKPFKIKLGPSGQQFNIQNYAGISDGLLRAINTQALSFGLDSLETGFQLYFATLMGQAPPRTPVRVSESWDSEGLLPNFAGSLTQVQGQNTLRSLQDGIAVVTTNAQAATPPEMPIPYEISGTISARARIDAASGLPLERNISAKLVQKLVDSDGTGRFVLRPVPQNLQIRMVLQPR